ncbi:YdcF family protein [Gluconobacter frateurii]|uniref:YdcF family protein n=1 Tax=Gluconobacter frateurii TaxID=38308 RepID=UPI001F0684E8|nr:YdcF family protein [Gluconobacter frateurii]UMM09182.1 YdcF family protein [Gluconobacter frateurii]
MKRSFLKVGLVALCVLGLLLTAWCGVVAWCGVRSSVQPAEMAVIFGTAVTDQGVPKPALRDRLETGLDLWKEHHVRTLMVSGAVETENHQDEAEIMAHWLEAHGVPASDIIVDSQGNNTWLTALHVAEESPDGAIVVSQWFHIMRAEWALRHAGVNRVSGAYPPRFRIPELWYLFREAVALPVYALTKTPPSRDGAQ